MKAILSADRKWGLGYQGRLLVSIPSDLRFFRETTMGHVVVMGRKTLATLPAGQPLKGRTNIILSRDPEWNVRGATVVHSIKELMDSSFIRVLSCLVKTLLISYSLNTE
mgnify:CR=1 FL=1